MTLPKTILLSIVLCCCEIIAAQQHIIISLEIPALNVSPYHKPYVAVWLETPQRQGVHSLFVWFEQDDWLKDMRQWWRKLGRHDRNEFAAVTGATRKPGHYKLQWNGVTDNGEQLAAGEYLLNFEASREAGGRDFIRQKIRWQPNSPDRQHYQLQGTRELGRIQIDIQQIAIGNK